MNYVRLVFGWAETLPVTKINKDGCSYLLEHLPFNIIFQLRKIVSSDEDFSYVYFLATFLKLSLRLESVFLFEQSLDSELMLCPNK